jgi:hypothetical protein
MNCKKDGRKRTEPTSMYYPGIRLEGLEKNHENLRIAGLREDI